MATPLSDDKKRPLGPSESGPPISPTNSRRASLETLETHPIGIPPTSPPAYDSLPGPSSSSSAYDSLPGPSSSSAYDSLPGPSSSSASTTTTTRNQGPTIDNPFNFPGPASLPPYSEKSILQRPIAIPQIHPSPTSPFLPAYTPLLLSLGIPPATWSSFLSTLSAFLSASVSTQALSHAAEIGRRVARVHTRLGRDLADHATSMGKEIGRSAKRLDLPAVVFQSLGLAMGSVGQVVGAAVSMPGQTVGALTRKPRSARERAEAYVAAANRDWLVQRGVRARILGTGELAGALQCGVEGLLERAQEGRGGGRRGVLKALEPWIGRLDVEDEDEGKREGGEEGLEIGRSTLWLVLSQQ